MSGAETKLPFGLSSKEVAPADEPTQVDTTTHLFGCGDKPEAP